MPYLILHFGDGNEYACRQGIELYFKSLSLFGTIRTRAHNNLSRGLRIWETDCQSNSNVIIVRGGTLNLQNSVGFSKKNDRLTFCMLLTSGE